jgi:hypothetical protein
MIFAAKKFLDDKLAKCDSWGVLGQMYLDLFKDELDSRALKVKMQVTELLRSSLGITVRPPNRRPSFVRRGGV